MTTPSNLESENNPDSIDPTTQAVYSPDNAEAVPFAVVQQQVHRARAKRHPLFRTQRTSSAQASEYEPQLPSRVGSSVSIWAVWQEQPVGWKISLIGIVAAVLMLVITAFQLLEIVTTLSSRLGLVQERLVVLESSNEELQQLNLTLQQQLLTQQDQMEILTAPAKVITLTSIDPALRDSQHGRLYARESMGLLVLRGLPPLPENQVYRLWLTSTQGVSVAADTIQVSSSGVATWLISLPLRTIQFTAVNISIEPAEKTQLQQGPTVLSGNG